MSPPWLATHTSPSSSCTTYGAAPSTTPSTSSLPGPVATPDAFLLLNQRTPQDADLSVLPTVLPPREFALQRDAHGAAWKVTGDAAEQRLSQSRRQILALFAGAPTPLTPTQVAALLDKPITTARSALWRMANDGLLIAANGRYHVPPDSAEQDSPSLLHDD